MQIKKKKGLLLFYVSNLSYLPIKILKIWRLLKYSVKLVKKKMKFFIAFNTIRKNLSFLIQWEKMIRFNNISHLNSGDIKY